MDILTLVLRQVFVVLKNDWTLNEHRFFTVWTIKTVVTNYTFTQILMLRTKW
jgi:hypothetical protein